MDAAFFPFYRCNDDDKTPKTRADANEDFYFSPGTMNAMNRAAGGAVAAVDALFDAQSHQNGVPSSFAIVRPPGHHCNGCKASGFCFLNNVAIAAAHARQVLGLERVAIVDWDYHHGDGTQHIFYDDPSVLTISIHAGMEFVDGIPFRDRVGEEGERYQRGTVRSWTILSRRACP